MAIQRQVLGYGVLMAALVIFTGHTTARKLPALRTIYRFRKSADGNSPLAGVTIGSSGLLYGTTSLGGAWNSGDVFSLTPPASAGSAWVESILYSFAGGPNDGFYPEASVVIGSGGELYGTTYDGGRSNSGTVFSLTPPASSAGSWTESVLYEFNATGVAKDGIGPHGGVVIGSGGVLYGATILGGSAPPGSCIQGDGEAGCGTIFSLTPPASPGDSWTEAVLYSFQGGSGDGANPEVGVVIRKDGVLYGVTPGGGTGSCFGLCGTVFSLSPPASPGGSWTETVLYRFTGGMTDGDDPTGIAVGTNGELYGTTDLGGASNMGTVFSLAPPTSSGGLWTETVLYNFTGGTTDGADPTGVVVGKNGVLYGTTSFGGTSNSGTVFSLPPPASPSGGWTETVLHSFAGGSDGVLPTAGVAISKRGVLCGTTEAGGISNHGIVFSLEP